MLRSTIIRGLRNGYVITFFSYPAMSNFAAMQRQRGSRIRPRIYLELLYTCHTRALTLLLSKKVFESGNQGETKNVKIRSLPLSMSWGHGKTSVKPCLKRSYFRFYHSDANYRYLLHGTDQTPREHGG